MGCGKAFRCAKGTPLRSRHACCPCLAQAGAAAGTLVAVGSISAQASTAQAFHVEGVSQVLVATDCLSEGVNLQHVFNAVIHYDLVWNPTRHEQREGYVRDTCNGVSQQESSRKVHLLGQCIGTVLGL
jgi:hypothetical protein